MILDVSVGFSGAMHNARMFRCSKLSKQLQQDRILDGPETILNGVSIP